MDKKMYFEMKMRGIDMILNFAGVLVVPLLADWVEIEDFAVLDTSICNSVSRPIFLLVISGNNFTHGTKSMNESIFYLHYLSVRSLKVRRLSLKYFEDHKFDFNIISQCIFSKLCHLKMKFCSNLVYLVNTVCSGIMSLDLSGSERLTDNLLEKLFERLTDLHHITLYNCVKFEGHKLDFLFRKFPELCGFSDCGSMSIVNHFVSENAFNLTSVELDELTTRQANKILINNPMLTSFGCFYCALASDSIAKMNVNLTALNLSGCGVGPDAAVWTQIPQRCHQLTDLNVHETLIDDLFLETVSICCKDLRILNVSGCSDFSNIGLMKVARGCPLISELNVSICDQVSDAALLTFASQTNSRLTTVDFTYCEKITDASASALLENCKLLTKINLSDTDVTDNCLLRSSVDLLSLKVEASMLANVSRTLENTRTALRGVTFQHYRSKPFNVTTLQTIALMSPNLQELSLIGVDALTDADVALTMSYCPLNHSFHFQDLITPLKADTVLLISDKCSHLRALKMFDMEDLTDDIVMKLVKAHPELTTLGFTNCVEICDSSVECIAEYCSVNLKCLALSGCLQVTNEAVISISSACSMLTDLDISGCEMLTSVVLSEINQTARKLKRLSFSKCVGIHSSQREAFLRAHGHEYTCLG